MTERYLWRCHTPPCIYKLTRVDKEITNEAEWSHSSTLPDRWHLVSSVFAVTLTLLCLFFLWQHQLHLSMNIYTDCILTEKLASFLFVKHLTLLWRDEGWMEDRPSYLSWPKTKKNKTYCGSVSWFPWWDPANTAAHKKRRGKRAVNPCHSGKHYPDKHVHTNDLFGLWVCMRAWIQTFCSWLSLYVSPK